MTMNPALTTFLEADIYGITDEALSAGRSDVETAALMLAAGVRVIQYRAKNKSGRRMAAECAQIVRLTRQAGAVFIVNDDPALALISGADGLHLGQDDLPAAAVRRLAGNSLIIGLSTHSEAQARAAQAEGIVDYIGVGPVFATGTKADASPVVGLKAVETAARLTVPFVAIGGINQGNIGSVRRAGARMFAVVSDIVGAADIAAKVQALRREITLAHP